MLVNADVFLSTVQSYRLVWISGRFGGGKTSLAYRISKEFLERGYRLVTNNMGVWADDPDEVQLIEDSGHLKAVILLDEGGLYFKASKQIEMIASYAAKMDCIYLLPSFWPPTKAAQVLIVQPIFNLKSAGLPVVVYKWKVRIGSFEDHGTFLWINPAEIYGIYSRQDPGDAGSDIVTWLIERTEQYRARFGHGGNGLSEMEEITAADILTDVAVVISEAADQWATVPNRKTGRRRI